MKRLFDVLGAGLGLLMLAPFLLGVGVVVVLCSGRPALFRQKRVGRGDRDFTLVKFRTMMVAPGADKSGFDAGNRSRITPIGRFLRRTKLDELPQLWNVLTGDMSLVGPRPEVRKWVAAFPQRWAIIHTVRPGATDPASIAFRNEEDLLAKSPDPETTYREVVLPQKLALYEDYVRTRTFWGDIRIILRTLRALAGLEPGL